MTAGAYKGSNDDQLDKINVYFNEISGSKSVIPPRVCRWLRHCTALR